MYLLGRVRVRATQFPAIASRQSSREKDLTYFRVLICGFHETSENEIRIAIDIELDRVRMKGINHARSRLGAPNPRNFLEHELGESNIGFVGRVPVLRHQGSLISFNRSLIRNQHLSRTCGRPF